MDEATRIFITLLMTILAGFGLFNIGIGLVDPEEFTKHFINKEQT